METITASHFADGSLFTSDKDLFAASNPLCGAVTYSQTSITSSGSTALDTAFDDAAGTLQINTDPSSDGSPVDITVKFTITFSEASVTLSSIEHTVVIRAGVYTFSWTEPDPSPFVGPFYAFMNSDKTFYLPKI